MLGLLLSNASVMAQAPAAGGAPGAQGFSWTAFLGPFHMLALHLPIGFVALAVVLELRSVFLRQNDHRDSMNWVMAASGMAGVVAAALGWCRAEGGSYAPELLSSHRAFGTVTAGVLLVAWALHASLGIGERGGRLWLFRLTLAACAACVGFTGHAGGSLTHGASFLADHAPAPLKSWLGGGGEAQKPKTEGGDLVAVPAVIQKKCASCHGAEKHKSGLRLDTLELAVKGGDSGSPAVTPGDPGRSELVRVCLLPRSHDQAMPPDGREPFTSAELDTVIRWIQQLPIPAPAAPAHPQ